MARHDCQARSKERPDLGVCEPDEEITSYGIQVDFGGNIWFVEVGSEHVAKLDPKTGTITEYKTPTPKSGPRRMTIDPQGIIWYAEWDAHKIGYINPKTLEQKEFTPPSHPKTGTYAIASDGAGNLYVAEFISNQVSRFEPKTGKWTEWPMPLRRSRVRNIVVDPKASVWDPGRPGGLTVEYPVRRGESGL